MPSTRSRFSHRHLLALCTFLVPLGLLAWLGQTELQRQGLAARTALEREARTFLQGAAGAVEQQFDRLPPVLARSRELLVQLGALRTAVQLREQEGTAALQDVLLLDEQLALVWPDLTLQNPTLSLPFARDARQGGDETAITNALQAADLLLTTGQLREGADLLQHLVQRLEKATPADSSGQRRPDDPELTARFRLGSARRALGEAAAARAEFETVRAATVYLRTRRGGSLTEQSLLGLLAEASLAELGATADCVELLRAIAEGRRDGPADGLLSALAARLAERVPSADPLHGDAQALLREERQRAQTRSFAGDYDGILKSDLRRRLLRQKAGGGEPGGDLELVTTLGNAATLLWVRDATAPETERLRCNRVALHFDLGQLLGPALPQLAGGTGAFVLSILDPADTPIVPPPAAVPADYVSPSTEVRGLTLRAYPANVTRVLADTQAAARNRTLLLVALFLTALGGALWLWRSVSREAELAALKVDLVSRVSHELKTPLALIRMYGETLGLGRARDAGQAAQFGGVIAREAERLTTLIQRILDFSRQQAGTLRYAPARVDLTELARNVCAAYAPHLEARGATLVDCVRPDVRVDCDASACESALVNLLENAAKYGIEGDDEQEIELELRAGAGTAVIEVRDRGRGIPEDELQRVFEGFYRASNAGEVRGAGLGLSLVRHFARAHGGEVTAAARPGGGSVFRLVLPLAAGPPPESGKPATDAPSPAPSPPPRP